MRTTGFIICCSVLIFSCSREEEEKGNVIPIDSMMLGYLFEKGSNWVYCDSLGVLDTTTVIETEESWRVVGGSGGRSKMILFLMTMKNNRDNENVLYEINEAYWRRHWYGELLFSPNYPVPTFYAGRNYWFLEHYPEYKFRNNTYYDVFKTRVYRDYARDTAEYENFMFADSVGMIQHEMYKQNQRVGLKELVQHRIIYHKLLKNE